MTILSMTILLIPIQYYSISISIIYQWLCNYYYYSVLMMISIIIIVCGYYYSMYYYYYYYCVYYYYYCVCMAINTNEMTVMTVCLLLSKYNVSKYNILLMAVM